MLARVSRRFASAGRQVFADHPNPKLKNLPAILAENPNVTPADLQMTDKDIADLLLYDRQCIREGLALDGVGAEQVVKERIEFQQHLSAMESLLDKSYSPATQAVIAEDLIYLSGATDGTMKTTVTHTSFPLQLLIAVAFGSVGALAYLKFANQERHRIHHKANAWRLEGPAGLKDI